MPVHNEQLIQSDPFVLSKSEVVHAVKKYLNHEGYETRNLGDLCDLTAANEYHTLFIEAQGNRAEHYKKEVVFSGSQLDEHLSGQLIKLLKNYEKNPAKTLVMANPDTPRIRKMAENLKSALDDLGVVRFWVKADGSIEWE
ncbi:hypothetical protein [Fictibacillus phosphorivorans]|uniref:hypothetical protein n=1 Tax=Fictibacillus phosphorivorans TaxID=1221500 RepID=UPI00203F5542|nr:hypothetical protein [Fictibacillus phosphorivorans]MCM3719250.1 hypothetical protein [Fictibacillus phosphorivorans]MCM3776872.1 hypothetical protein [Fictibacillus phosphorivorans]